MYRFRSIKYLATTGLISAILVIISFITQFISIPGLNGIIQFSDGLYFALIVLIKGPMMLFAGIVYVFIVDLSSGVMIFIPISITIRVLMYLIIYYLTKYITKYASFLLAAIMVLIYPFYTYLIYGESFAIAELIFDSVQLSVSYIVGIIANITLEKINKNSDYKLWNDGEFNKYKNRDAIVN